MAVHLLVLVKMVVLAAVAVVVDQMLVELQHQAKEIMVDPQLQDYVAAQAAVALEDQDQIQDQAPLTLTGLQVVQVQLHHYQELQ